VLRGEQEHGSRGEVGNTGIGSGKPLTVLGMVLSKSEQKDLRGR
jgi:hypothetical protein